MENTYSNTHTITLYGDSHSVRLDEEGYTLLLQIVCEHQVCAGCYTNFTNENPNVSGNYCLSCFTSRGNPGHGLVLQGEIPMPVSGYPHPSDALCHRFWFLSQEGYAYTSTGGPGYQHSYRQMDAFKDMPRTLEHWGFPLPETGEHNGQTLKASTGRINGIYGDIKEAQVIVITYNLSLPKDKVCDLYFISQRGGRTMQINKRKAAHRAMLEEARQAVGNHGNIYDYIARRFSEELAVHQPALL